MTCQPTSLVDNKETVASFERGRQAWCSVSATPRRLEYFFHVSAWGRCIIENKWENIPCLSTIYIPWDYSVVGEWNLIISCVSKMLYVNIRFRLYSMSTTLFKCIVLTLPGDHQRPRCVNMIIPVSKTCTVQYVGLRSNVNCL